MFLKNKLRCSPKFTFTEFPCSQKLCSMFRLDPPKYSSLFPTISLIFHFHFRLLERACPATILRKYLTEIKFVDRKTALQQRNKCAGKKLSLPFVITQYDPALLPSLKTMLMGKWRLIQSQQRLREIFKKPPVIQLPIQLISAGVV